MRIYMVNRNRVDLCLQGSGDLRMCASQTDRNTARNLSVFGRSFDVLSMLSGIWCEFDVMCFFAAGACACIRTYSVYISGEGIYMQ